MSNIIKGLDAVDKEIGMILTIHYAKFSNANTETELTVCLMNAIADFRLYYEEIHKKTVGNDWKGGKNGK